ncbi:MAG: phosphoribosyltransferase family protein [Patescibacteria group bacterium]|jgi:predicted phosphoribosyltransferase
MFRDRIQAGRKLAEELQNKMPKILNGIVLALPRGGVVVGAEIAEKLSLPLDIIVTRKIGHPANPEYAIGAVSEHEIILNPNEEFNPYYISTQAIKERREIIRRKNLYGGKKPAIPLVGKTVFLVDDGVATGLTVQVAVMELKTLKPRQIIVATPAISPSTLAQLQKKVDAVVTLIVEPKFYAVGQFYKDFPQISDNEVKHILQGHSKRTGMKLN